MVLALYTTFRVRPPSGHPSRPLQPDRFPEIFGHSSKNPDGERSELSVFPTGQALRGGRSPTRSAGPRRAGRRAQPALSAPLDARLRIKFKLPKGLQKEDLEHLGQPGAPDSTEPNAYNLYAEQCKSKPPKLLMQRLHDALHIEKDAFWVEVMGQEFAKLDNAVIGAVATEEEEVDETAINELATLLEVGLQGAEQPVAVL